MSIKEKLDQIREIYGSLYHLHQIYGIPETTMSSWYIRDRKPQAVVEPFLDLVIENHKLKQKISELEGRKS